MVVFLQKNEQCDVHTSYIICRCMHGPIIYICTLFKIINKNETAYLSIYIDILSLNG